VKAEQLNEIIEIFAFLRLLDNKEKAQSNPIDRRGRSVKDKDGER
jgi:hypothetical protein